MKNLSIKSNKGYLSKLTSAVGNLLSANESLSFRNIRPAYLRYFFVFPLSMVFVNTQDFMIGNGIRMFGLAYTTVTFLAFIAGAVLLFVISTQKNISSVCKLSAALTAIGFISMLFLQSGYPSLVCAIILMAGIGGCVSSSSFSFVFVLNNAERFFGSALMVLLIKLFELIAVFPAIGQSVRIGLAIILLIPLCLCMALSKSGDYSGTGEKAVKKFDMSIWLALFIFLSYFAIRITGFYAPAFGHPSSARLWGIFAMALLVLCILMQVMLRRSIWTLCNVFFLSSILSYVMWYVNQPALAYLFSELKDIGLLISFYLIGCVTNKFCDFRIHKRLVLVCMAAIGILYVGIDALHARMLDQNIAIITAAVLFAVFLLLSPAFSQHLFFAQWSKEFRQVCMTFLCAQDPQANKSKQIQLPTLDDTALSPREKQVVLLLLRGMTLRQVAPELGLTFSTVSTYSKTIYKKLGINSRAELFMLFGQSSEPLSKSSDTAE